MRVDLLAFLMLAVQVLAFAYYSHGLLFAGCMLLLSVIGVVRNRHILIGKRKELILTGLLLLPFFIEYFFYPFQNPRGFYRYPLTHAIAQYCLLLQVIHFFLRSGSFSGFLPFYGCIVMLHAGNVYRYGYSHYEFLTFSCLFILFAVLYCINCQPAALKRDSTKERSDFLRLHLIVPVLIASLVVGLLLHRFGPEIEKAFGSVLGEGLASYGFRSICTLESMTRIRTGDENYPALRIYSKSPPGYLRGVVYSWYKDSQWQVQPASMKRKLQAMPAVQDKQDGYNCFVFREIQGKTFSYEIWPDWILKNGMFTPADASMLLAPYDSVEIDENGVVKVGEVVRSAYYTFYSPIQKTMAEESPELLRNCAEIPPGLDPSILKLSETIFQGCHTFDEKVTTVTSYLKENHRYQLGIQIPEGADPITYFLQNKVPAHCEYFATAAAILLRLARIPARYITGYLVTEENPWGGYWVGRNGNAHAWVEAYDTLEGWVTVEATPADGLSSGTGFGIGSLWDYLAFSCEGFFVRIETQGFSWLKDAFLLFVVALPGYIAAAAPFVLAAFCLIYLIRRLAKRGSPGVQYEFPSRYRRVLNQADRLARRNGFSRDGAETISSFADRIYSSGGNGAKLSEWYKSYARHRFGGTISEFIEELERELEKLK
ncbi:MAG: transglutaminaseTgpA domain-containing protein [Candidatus Wallbacteria bacterium]|nr:transglutaminaseTgpA domain-containing protein [Candidatus Wallbacteria bacterium]